MEQILVKNIPKKKLNFFIELVKSLGFTVDKDAEEKPDEKRLSVDDFSFKNAREKLKRYNGSLSDAIIEERRNNV